ncbi:Fur family transcriptional regulator [Brevibacillus sp. NRS-1366]|uniref:Fur family transcriptional regulator n=1 Tax=Brevibacillus sp. NRS-1366 TaxID=3233899 RepID=UPI003D1DA6C2
MDEHIASVTEQVKDLGKRLTAQRRAVLLHMLTSRRCSTAKDVYHSLKNEMPNITLSTVYTSLRFFVKMGILKEHVHHDSPNLFESITAFDAIQLKEVM